MKSYTDLEQSRKLAKILPLENADMYYLYDDIVYAIPYKNRIGEAKPCWSLSALLDVLPKIGAEEPMIRKLYYANAPKERYICQYSLTNMTSEYDNPVDACFQMILKLHELNLL